MKSNLNPNYIEYKAFFIASAYNQQISENLVELFIKVNNQTYFPEFIFYKNYSDYSNEVCIEIERLDDIVHKILYKLAYNKCDEIDS